MLALLVNRSCRHYLVAKLSMAYKVKKRFKRLVITTTTITVFAAVAYLLGWSSVLTVKSIEITGTTATQVILNQLQNEEISLQVGQKFARVDPRAIERSVSKLDWLAVVSVSRDWISKQVSIAVIERVAVARALTSENSMVNFDISGVIFKPISKAQIMGQDLLPIVSTAGDSKADLSGVVKLLQQLPENLQYLIEDLQQISVTKSGDILMKTRINQLPVQINWGGVQQLEQKYSILIALLKLPENNEIRQVDLSEPSAPVVK